MFVFAHSECSTVVELSSPKQRATDISYDRADVEHTFWTIIRTAGIGAATAISNNQTHNKQEKCGNDEDEVHRAIVNELLPSSTKANVLCGKSVFKTT